MITINHPHIAVNARTNACFCPGKLSIRKTEQEIKSVCTIRNALVVERHLAWVWTYNHPRSRSVASEVVFSCPFVCVCVCVCVCLLNRLEGSDRTSSEMAAFRCTTARG